MDKKSEAGRSRASRSSSSQKRSKSARLPHKPSYPLADVAAAWRCEEQQLVDYIKLDWLECCVLLHQQEYKIPEINLPGLDVESTSFSTELLSGHYRLLPDDAVKAYLAIPGRTPISASSSTSLTAWALFRTG